VKFFNPFAEIRQTANRLPHWQQEGGAYFVTFRLADSIPATLRDRWDDERRQWLTFHPLPWTAKIEKEHHERFSAQMERWLDAGHGSCVLRNPEYAAVVDQAIRRFDGKRLSLIASVVMPNHVHAVFVQNGGYPVENLMRGWKSLSAGSINRSLRRTGALWQRDYFDRMIRNQKHLDACIHYIRSNPGKARLRRGEYILFESETAKRID
jgi:putative transposase